MPTLSFRVDDDDFEWIKARATQRQMTVSDYFRYALELREKGQKATRRDLAVGNLEERLVSLEEQVESYEQRLTRIEELASQSSY